MILVLNLGSQSIKWKLFNEERKLLKEGKSLISVSEDYQRILETDIARLSGYKISAIGHRVVHSGGMYRGPLKITEQNLQELERFNYLAPLHNLYNILGIRICQKIFPDIPQLAFFDTDFFISLPEYAFTYALPEKIVKENNFKRFGFHGISHEYTLKEASKKIKKPFNKLKIISCHLGGGASIVAIKDGKAIDVSMGFTPLEGLVMMTRSGNIDTGIILQMAKKYGIERSEEILNKESGIKGICGESEMLKVLNKIESGDTRAKLALDVFVYSIKKYIGAYFAVLGGCDALVFTGAIGEGSAKIRNMICKSLEILNKTKILTIKTDEESAIAEKLLNIKL